MAAEVGKVKCGGQSRPPHSLVGSPTRAYVSSCLPIGSARMRFPVAAKMALVSAGANGGTPGSPTPLGGVSAAHLLALPGERINPGVYRNLVPHNSFPCLAVEYLEPFDLRWKLLSKHRSRPLLRYPTAHAALR